MTNQEKNQLLEIDPEIIKTMRWLDKPIKIAIINLFNNLKENMKMRSLKIYVTGLHEWYKRQERKSIWRNNKKLPNLVKTIYSQI